MMIAERLDMMIAERLERLAGITLLAGKHADEQDGMCVMEAAAWVAGESFTDHPSCVCPVIGAFLRSWNDAITDDKERTRLLTPLIEKVIGTRATPDVEAKRAFLCVDWAIRSFLPDWLAGCDASYASHAAALRTIPEITDWDSLANATPVLADVQKRAAAARDAARDAARAKLTPLKEKLQAGAVDLVRHLCACVD